MASSRQQQEELRSRTADPAHPAHPDSCSRNFSLLVVVGRAAHPGHALHIGTDIERGIRSWDIDLNSCNLNQYLQEFLSQHTASFKGAGQKCLRHNTRVLDTLVLISPTQDQVQSEVSSLLSRDSGHKLLVLSGQSLEETGDLLLHRGHFSAGQLRHILTEQSLAHDSPAPKPHLSLSCPNAGLWRATLLGEATLYALSVNPPAVLPAMASLAEFASLVSGAVSPPSPFDLLAPPTTVGFLKLSRPCVYVFPAGRGDCAFLAVNGFTVLVDGGADARACFWKLVRHLDRVDAVLLTHVGTDNLPGVNALLERKAAELEVSAEVKDDWSKRLISPELGVVFFNAPSRLQVDEPPCVDTVMTSTHQAALTLRLLKKLNIRPQPLFRPQGVPIEPLTLFQKMGVGQLDLYILSPAKTSPEYQTFMHSWPDAASSSASKSQTLPLTALASVCALLVWHPACPQEKVVRVLFPGATPQAKLLQGLEKLKGLAFLQKPAVTTGDVEKLGADRRTKRTESQDGGKESASKKDEVPREKGKSVNGVVGRDAEKTKGGKQKGAEKNTAKKGGGKKNEEIKNDQGDSKPKNGNKSKLKKEAKNDAQTGVKKTRKPSGKDASGGEKGKANAEPTKHDLGGKTEQQGPKTGSDPQDVAETERSKVQETSDKENRKSSENEKIPGSTSKEAEDTRGTHHKAPTEEKATPAKVVGFPSPLNVAPKCERTVQLDVTPTEYTLLDGALRNSPPSRSSPENPAPVSLDEHTVEPGSPDSRPNSAGHTPYCLSPDDVWCNRATLSRLQAQMGNSESAKSNPEGNTRERQLGFLSLGTFKEGPSDPSPSFTTTTTHSMPAEVSSPQSTEVDESLSMSLEQGPTTARDGEDGVQNGGHFVGVLPAKKPPRSSAGPGPNVARPAALHFEASSHDVDLCLVSPCEFKHLKQPDANSGTSEDASRGAFAALHPGGGNNNNNPKDMSPSESNAPACTEDCASTTADGGLDSDEDEECSEPSNSPRNQRAGRALPPDPLPAPLRDAPPIPPHPDTAMPVPQSDGKKAKAAAMRGKKAPVISEASQKSGKSRTPSGNSKVPSSRTPSSSARSAKSSPDPGSKSSGEVGIYVDLSYIPSGASSPTVSVDFFRCVRSSCYIISGDSQERAELMRQTLDALLDAKMSWPDAVQVTVIPTFDSVPMQEWYQQTLTRQKELGVTVLGSNSTVAMQDETFPACKIEF